MKVHEKCHKLCNEYHIARKPHYTHLVQISSINYLCLKRQLAQILNLFRGLPGDNLPRKLAG
jgi:hypothetical protein